MLYYYVPRFKLLKKLTIRLITVNFFAFRSSKDGGSGSVGDGVNESEKNIVTSSQDFWDWRSSFSDIGGGQKVLLASTLSSPGMIHIPRNTVLQQESLQVKLNFF